MTGSNWFFWSLFFTNIRKEKTHSGGHISIWCLMFSSFVIGTKKKSSRYRIMVLSLLQWTIRQKLIKNTNNLSRFWASTHKYSSKKAWPVTHLRDSMDKFARDVSVGDYLIRQWCQWLIITITLIALQFKRSSINSIKWKLMRKVSIFARQSLWTITASCSLMNWKVFKVIIQKHLKILFAISKVAI